MHAAHCIQDPLPPACAHFHCSSIVEVAFGVVSRFPPSALGRPQLFGGRSQHRRVATRRKRRFLCAGTTPNGVSIPLLPSLTLLSILVSLFPPGGAFSHTSYPLFLFLFSFWPLACSLFSPSVLSRGNRLALGSDCRKERGREGGDVVSICFGFVSVVVDLFPFTFLWVLSSLYPHPPHCRESVLVFVIPYPPHSSAYPNLPSSVPVKALFFKRVACNAAV